MELREGIATKSPWLNLVIGQDSLWARLLPSIQYRQFPHLCLLSARPGNCQLPLAISIAQALLCESNDAPCGSCSNCHQVNGLVHPDLHFSFPLLKAKEICQDHYPRWRKALTQMPYMGIADWFSCFEEESKNANIPVSEVQNIIELLQLKPFVSGNKVLVLWLPEYLGKESNRLLKLFEEPPEKTYIILVTEQPAALLPTVKSRALHFHLNAIPVEVAANKLAELHDLDYSLIYSALISSESNLQEAIDLVNNKRENLVMLLQQLLKSCYQYQASEMVSWVENFCKGNREDQKFYLIWMQRVFSFVLRNKYTGKLDDANPSSDLIQYSKKLSQSLSLEQIEEINKKLDDGLFALQRNANVKIFMTDFAIQLSSILRNKLN